MMYMITETLRIQFWRELQLKTNWALVSRLVFVFLALYTILITAWVGDDAHITFRQIWNFINGHGITFNYEARVQAFTHPLWFILVSYLVLFTREFFFTTLLFSVALSISAILILFKIEISHQRNKLTVLSPVFALVFSWAFCDYSTSGLENPLSYFLVGVLIYLISLQQWKNHLRNIYFVLALLVLNRVDIGILFFPTMLVLLTYVRHSGGVIKTLLPGALILIAWFVFATIYFGSPLPNTFYAKLYSNYPIEEILERGGRYFTSLRRDMVSIIIILSGIIVSCVSFNRILVSMAIGQILYMVYIYFIGGDFMQGRFFALLVYLSLGQIVLSFVISDFWKNRSIFVPVLVFLIIIVHIGAYREFPFKSGTDYTPRKRVDLIYDERGFYYSKLGLFSIHREGWPHIQDYSDNKPTRYVTTCGLIGSLSFHDTSYQLIDNCALTDPFLSKIPAVRSGKWRIGHHLRKLPQEYGEYLIGNITELPDEKLNYLLNDIKLASYGDLFTFERFGAIYRLNTNFHSDIDFSDYQDPDIFIPVTKKIEIIELEDWEKNLPYENLPKVLDYVRYRKFNNNIKIISQKPEFAKGLYIVVDSKFSYDIYVNNKIVKQVKYNETKPNAHETYTSIKFKKPIYVKSVTIKATDVTYKNKAVAIPEFNFIHDFKLQLYKKNEN